MVEPVATCRAPHGARVEGRRGIGWGCRCASFRIVPGTCRVAGIACRKLSHGGVGQVGAERRTGFQREGAVDALLAAHVDQAHGPGGGRQVAGCEVVVVRSPEGDPRGVAAHGDAVDGPGQSPGLQGTPVGGAATRAADGKRRFGAGCEVPGDGRAPSPQRGQTPECRPGKVDASFPAATAAVGHAHQHAVGVATHHDARGACARSIPVVAVDGRIQGVPGGCTWKTARSLPPSCAVEGRLARSDGIRRQDPRARRGGEREKEPGDGGRDQGAVRQRIRVRPRPCRRRSGR